MKHEYHEGPEAGENFRRLAVALFQAPKNGRKNKAQKKRQPKKATSHRKSGSDKD